MKVFGYRLAAIVAAMVGCSCSLLGPAGAVLASEPIHPGEVRVVTEDSAVQTGQGGSFEKLPHREMLREREGMVLPAGAVVRVTDFRNSSGGGQPSPQAVWIYVTVQSSPFSRQQGWKGWIH